MPFVSLRSSVFTSTADALFRGTVTLCRISLPEFDGNPATTLYLSTKPYVDPDGQPWDPALMVEPSIDHGGGWLAFDWNPVDCTLSIIDMRLSGQGASESFTTMLSQYPFVGAGVEVLQAFDNLTSVSEFKTLFSGKIARPRGIQKKKAVFWCVQDRSWSKLLPSRTVTKDDFEDAPSGVIGAAIPIVIGDWETDNRYLDGGSGTDEAVYTGIARGACPMLPISSPTGATLALPKHLISDDEIDQGVLPGGAPYDQWYMYDSTLDCMVGPGIGALDNPTDGPATLSLTTIQLTGAVLPVEVDAANTAENPQWCLRKDKKRNLGDGYAYLNFDAFKRILKLNLPDVPPLGKFVSASVRVWYQKPATTGTLGQFYVANTLVNTPTIGHISNSASSGGYTSDGYEDVASEVVSTTEINDWDDIKNCYIWVDCRAAGQETKIHHVALNIDYMAAARTERPGVQRDVSRFPEGAKLRPAFAKFPLQATSPDLVTFDSVLYGYPRGRKDTAAGIYTGTASALIQHPVDIVRYLLKRWCGVSAGEIVENSGDFGAFPDAKTALTTYQFRTILSQRASAYDHIRAIGAESLCWFKRCPTLPGAPFVAVPWELGSAVDYRTVSEPFVFYRTRAHVVADSFEVGYTGISDVANSVRVNYDWDPRTNTYGDQVYITPTASRVSIAGLFGADSGRESTAADSEDVYDTSELVVSLQMVSDPATATAILSRLFDLRVEPHVTVTFETFVNAYDLNRGHVIAFSSDWDDRMAFPRAGSDGTWDGKLFRVVSVKRLSESPIRYEVQAVEI